MRLPTQNLATTALLALFSGCDAPEARERLECSNNLKQVGLALVLYSQEHDHLIPHDFSAIASSNYFDVSPSVFVCPADRTKRRSEAANWGDFAPAEVSYFLPAPSVRLEADGTNDLVRCPIHQQVAFLQGNGVRTRRETSNPYRTNRRQRSPL
jgi:hypothetical protein